MARKVNDACMFCFGAGCEVCVKPSKKATKKARAPKPAEAAPTTSPVVDTKADIKAAMKSVAVKQVVDKEEDDRELLDALVALEPLLHPDELATIRDELDNYKPRAERWRWRREYR